MPLVDRAVDANNIGNLKDILLTYNRITEACFSKCASTLNYKTLTPKEEACVNCCAGKFINGNQRLIQTYMELSTKKQQKMFEEMQQQEALQQQQQQQQQQQLEQQQPPQQEAPQ